MVNYQIKFKGGDSANLTEELKPIGIMVVSMHPGWAMTYMGGAEAYVPINDIFNTLSKLCGKSDTGKFLDYKWHTMSW